MTNRALQWTAHPARRRPHDVLLAACVIALTAWAVLVGLGSGWLAVIAVVILVIAIAPFLVRTHYQLDGDGIAVRRLFVTQSRKWSELRRFEVGRTSAIVSPYASRRWLDRYRGLTIYFDGTERDRVILALEARLVR